MRRKDVEAAIKNRSAVIYDGIRYERIVEYVIWFDKRGNRQMSLILLDRNRNCVVRTLVERVELADAGPDE